MTKFCCYALIILLLLFLVFFIDYQRLLREAKQLDVPDNLLQTNNSDQQDNDEAIVRKDLRTLLQKYLQSEKEPATIHSENQILNRFLPDIKPVKGGIISQQFTELHNGIDIAAPRGKIVIAAASGKIKKAGYDDYFGNLIIIDHLNGYITFYGHLSEIFIEENFFAEKESQIGTVGSTGFSTGPHLHYSISKNQIFVDPKEIWLD